MNIIYKINNSKKEDIDSHLSITNEYFNPPLSTKLNLLDFAEKIYNNATRFEAWDEEELIGLISCYCNKEVAFINHVAIIKKFQGLGIAKILMKNCIDYTKEKRFKEIELEVSINNKEAINLYKLFNFSIVNETDENF